MKLDIRRAFWGMVLGGLLELIGSLGAIWAIDANNVWAREGCMALMLVGVIVLVSAFRRGLKAS